MIESHNTDLITFHYVCAHPGLLSRIDHNIFKQMEIKLLYKLIREFYVQFAVMPSFRNIDPIREISGQSKEVQMFSPVKKVEENVADFLAMAELIITHPIDNYPQQWVATTAESYIIMRQFENGMQNTIDWWQKQAAVTPGNVKMLVAQAQSLFLSKSTIVLYEEQPINFWSPESHIQTQKENLIECGWPILNRFLNGGFERKTLTHLWGAPNVGKSLFLGTIGRDVSINGKNVFIGSLEMDTRKYAKRMGSSIFGIPVNEYSGYKDSFYFHERMKLFLDTKRNDHVVVPGALFIQRFTHATPATITLAADKLGKELGIKWDMVIYDYLGEMESAQNFSLESMYAMHKTNNAELFDHAISYDWAALTAHQVSPEFFDAGDMSLKASAESRGISHRTDNIFGILQDPVMYSSGKFFLKNLKARDNEFKNFCMRLSINWSLMNLTDDQFIVKPTENILA